jgi:hypothetical protein
MMERFILRNMKPCSLLRERQCFGGTCRSYLQGNKQIPVRYMHHPALMTSIISRQRTWRRFFLRKHQSTWNGLHTSGDMTFRNNRYEHLKSYILLQFCLVCFMQLFNFKLASISDRARGSVGIGPLCRQPEGCGFDSR